MSALASLFDRSREAFHAFQGVAEGAGNDDELAGQVTDNVVTGIGSLVSRSGLTRLGGSPLGSLGKVSDVRDVLFWVAVVFAVLLFAAITNPTEASFRSYLTEQSFRRHLADSRGSDDPCGPDDAQLPSSAPPTQNGKPADKSSLVEPPSVAPFRFANHVAISLRTPNLVHRSLLFFSLASTSPIGPPAYLSDPVGTGKGKKETVRGDRIVLYFGFMSHWRLLGVVPSQSEWIFRTLIRAVPSGEKKKKGTASERAGVLEMRAVSVKEETLAVPPAHSSPHSSKVRKSDSSRELNDTLRSALHHQTSIPVATIVPGSRRGSVVNIVTSPPTPPALETDVAPSPLVITLKAELATTQALLTDLQAQLDSHDVSISDAHSGLQSTIEDLRTRRKDDDAERQELKSRTRQLEEQKRQAEGARRDAEKKLRQVESVRESLEARIAAALGEIKDLKGQMEGSERNMRVLEEQGAKYVVDVREQVKQKRRELETVEEEVGEAEHHNEELGSHVKEAEDRLRVVLEAGENQQRVAPEEEMMLMAAAYEAAAQEGYYHGHAAYGHGPLALGQHGMGATGGQAAQGQWASQAAAYMAEAGMPMLGQDYTARPINSNSAGFGHLARPHGSISGESGKRYNDMGGFEDFGPGLGTSPLGREGLHMPPPARRVSTPPHSDTESDIYGSLSGSPSGGMGSSFTANLLPQGLFRSLEGDATPQSVQDDDDAELDLLQPPLMPVQDGTYGGHFVPGHVDQDDGSESSSGGHSAGEHGRRDDAWPSPLGTAGNQVERVSSSRFLPPSTTPPHSNSSSSGHVSVLGLPSLTGSRRWVSASNSSENLAFPLGTGQGPFASAGYGFLHPPASNSNETLLLNPGAFAPSAGEQKELAARRWAPLGKYPWAKTKPSDAGANAPGQVSAAPGAERSAALSAGSSWFASRFGSLNASANANGNGGLFAAGSGSDASLKGSNGIEFNPVIGNPLSRSTSASAPRGAGAANGVPHAVPEQSEEEDDRPDKRLPRFSFLRKNTSRD